MGIFLTIISFPFWIFGGVVVYLGLFGTVTRRGAPAKNAIVIKFIATTVGCAMIALAYLMSSFG